jgi:DtxR family transcriptional regulator, Mn-dependent transcriptional regulator
MLTTTSTAVQDYLKGLYLIGEAAPGAAVTTTAIAQQLGVSPAAATAMLKKLDQMGLVDHSPYKGVKLTEAGSRVALEVLRHHRLLETYLVRALGYRWDEVHAEAEVLEHVLSEELEERIAALLGHPTADPHGHPIPSKDLTSPPAPVRRLWDVTEGERVVVDRVSDNDPEVLRYLATMGVIPGSIATVTRRGPVGGPLFVDLEGIENALSRELAEAVWVA